MDKPTIHKFEVLNVLKPDFAATYLTTTPQEAVKYCYAQEGMGDYTIREYSKYDHLVIEGESGYYCGDFYTKKQQG